MHPLRPARVHGGKVSVVPVLPKRRHADLREAQEGRGIKIIMTYRIGKVVIIENEPDDVCELCGKVAECRPYGPKGERICWECVEKDPISRDRMIAKKLFGEGEIQ